MNTLEAIAFLDAEAETVSQLANGIQSIGRDATEFKERTAKLRECGRKLAVLHERFDAAARNSGVVAANPPQA